MDCGKSDLFLTVSQHHLLQQVILDFRPTQFWSLCALRWVRVLLHCGGEVLRVPRLPLLIDLYDEGMLKLGPTVAAMRDTACKEYGRAASSQEKEGVFLLKKRETQRKYLYTYIFWSVCQTAFSYLHAFCF
jgi:hypothetical protein